LIHGADAPRQLGDGARHVAELVIVTIAILAGEDLGIDAFLGGARRDRPIEPFVERHAGMAGRFRGSLAGLLIDSLDIPRHAGFHRPYNPLPRREFRPPRGRKDRCRAEPMKGIGRPIPASPESSANMVNGGLIPPPAAELL